MNTPRYRGWRFTLPRRTVPAEAAGLRLNHTGGIAMVEERESVRQAILLLLSTMPGERVMRPEYGCDLEKLVFAPNDDTTAGLAMHYVRQAVTRWEPRVEVLRVDAVRKEEDPGGLDIVLEYQLRALVSTERLVFPVMLSGEQHA